MSVCITVGRKLLEAEHFKCDLKFTVRLNQNTGKSALVHDLLNDNHCLSVSCMQINHLCCMLVI